MLKGKKIFITGGAGFIGSLLAEKMSAHNKICIYDNLDRNALQHRDVITEENVEFVKGDILDIESLQKVIAEFKPTHVIHCAAIAGIDTVIQIPTKTLRVNILGTANLLDVLFKQEINCERIVLFSTSEIFGQHAFQSSEKHAAVIGAVGEARWTYAVSKLTNEHLGFAYFKEFGFPCAVVRPFNVYGPGQVGEGALSVFIKKALKNEPIMIHGDGTQIRAWCYVDDMVDGVLKCLTVPKAIGESFNIGNRRAVTTIYGLASTVCRILNSSSEIKFSGNMMADVELRIPDVSKSYEVLGFEAKVDLEQGIPLTAEYYKRVMEKV